MNKIEFFVYTFSISLFVDVIFYTLEATDVC